MFYRVINSTVNNVFAKAVEVMNNSRKFEVLKPKEELKEDSSQPKDGKKKKTKKQIKVVTK